MANIGPILVSNIGQYCRCVALPTLGQYCAKYYPNIVHNIAPTLAQYCLPAGVSVSIVYFDSIPTTKSRSFTLTELGINSSFWTVCCLWGYIFDQYSLWWKDVKHDNYFWVYYSSNYHIHRYGLLRLRNDLYCVEWGVKLYSLTHATASKSTNQTTFRLSQFWCTVGLSI